MGKIFVAALAIAVVFCTCCTATLADVVVDWSGSVQANEAETASNGVLSTVESEANLSLSSPINEVLAFSSFGISIPAADTVSFSLDSVTDHGTAGATFGSAITATFKPVSSTLKAGTPVEVMISLSLTGSLSGSAGSAIADSSMSLTSSLGPPFDQSVALSGFESTEQPLSLTESAIVTAFVGQDFALDPTIDFTSTSLGGGEDGFAGIDAFGTLSFSAESLDSEASVIDSSCNQTYSGTFAGNITVSSGETCVTGTVTGNVSQSGGILIANGATIEGNVRISGGVFMIGAGTAISGNLQIHNLPAASTPIRVCDAKVKGNLQVNNNAEPIAIGTGLLSCPGNIVGGNLQVDNNSGPIQVFDDSVSGNLHCKNNLSITTGGNSAKSIQGECAGF
jgi:hypothetical protein